MHLQMVAARRCMDLLPMRSAPMSAEGAAVGALTEQQMVDLAREVESHGAVFRDNFAACLSQQLASTTEGTLSKVVRSKDEGSVERTSR